MNKDIIKYFSGLKLKNKICHARLNSIKYSGYVWCLSYTMYSRTASVACLSCARHYYMGESCDASSPPPLSVLYLTHHRVIKSAIGAFRRAAHRVLSISGDQTDPGSAKHRSRDENESFVLRAAASAHRLPIVRPHLFARGCMRVSNTVRICKKNEK